MNRRHMSPREIRRENLVILLMTCIVVLVVGIALYVYFYGLAF
jgi:flagellar basal body-associated protein FliL